MNEHYKQQQTQFTSFLDELEQLFLKHNINSVSTYNNCLIFRRPKDTDWLFDFWTYEESFIWPSVRKYKVEATIVTTPTDEELDTIMTEQHIAEDCAKLIPITEEPQHKSVTVGEETIITPTEPTTEVDINPKIEEYINDLADRLYATAKEMNFPKNTLGEYWTHPKVVFAVKKAGFNESAYTIISSNTTYWNCLAMRMKLVEALDRQNTPIVEEPVVETKPVEEEPITHMETFSTDSILGTWTVHYSDYKDSVYIDSDKGRSAISNKVHNWLLIYSRIHPELKNVPTKANIIESFNNSFATRQSFQYKWYEFIVDVYYSTPIESEEL